MSDYDDCVPDQTTENRLLAEVDKQLAGKIADSSTITKYESGESAGYAKFVYSPEIRRRVVEAVVRAMGQVVGIWRNNPPTSRRGDGQDGGQTTTPGGKYNLR